MRQKLAVKKVNRHHGEKTSDTPLGFQGWSDPRRLAAVQFGWLHV
jgi:hypothetical protein